MMAQTRLKLVPQTPAPPQHLVIRVLLGSMHHFGVRVNDWLLASMMVTFGFVLSRDPSVFDSAHSFAVLAEMGTANEWSRLCWVVGGVRLAALTINGTFPVFRWSPHIRFSMSLTSCFIWFQLTLGIALEPSLTAALAIYPYLFLFDMYNTFLAASEAGVVERLHRNGGR